MAGIIHTVHDFGERGKWLLRHFLTFLRKSNESRRNVMEIGSVIGYWNENYNTRFLQGCKSLQD